VAQPPASSQSSDDRTTENSAELLASLGEKSQREPGEAARLGRERVVAAGDRDHRAGELGAGPEALGGERGESLDRGERVGDDGDGAVVARAVAARRRRKASR
jgi:hypothetical protein